MNKKWEYYKIEDERIEEICNKFEISELLSKILLNRGLNEKEIEIFLNPTRNDFYDPFLMPDMEKAVGRIIKAINEKEKVLIYGDYDVDRDNKHNCFEKVFTRKRIGNWLLYS